MIDVCRRAFGLRSIVLMALIVAGVGFGPVLAQQATPPRPVPPPAAAPAATPAAPGAAQQPPRMDVEQMRQALTQIETQLQRDDLTDTQLEQLRGRVLPILDNALAGIARETPRLDEINARLERIGPAPKDKEPAESAEVARNRAEQEALKKEIDESLRVVRLVQVRAEQGLRAIIDYRQRLFRRELLARTESLASPWLWWEVLRAVPEAGSNFVALLTFRLRHAVQSLDSFKLGIGLVMILVALLGYIPAKRLLFARLDHWAPPKATSPNRGQRAAAALRGTVLRVLLAVVVSIVLTGALKVLGLGADRLGEFIRVLLFLFPVLVLFRGLLIGVLQPERPAWRVARIEQKTAEHLYPALWSVVLIVFAGKVIEAAGQSISAALPMTVAARGLAALLAAIVLLQALRSIDAHQDAQEEALDEFGPAVAASAGDTYAILLKVMGWVTGVTVIAAVLLGFISLGAFLMDQLIWLLGLGAALTLVLITVDAYLARGTKAEGALASRIRASTGIAPSSIQQFGILASGVVRLFVYAVGIMLALAPFGINSGDLLGSARAVLFGFSIGGVNISISSILLAVVAFLLLLFVFRSVQRWVEKTYLPSTSLDHGLQNSIVTIIGYIGFILATVLSMGYLGFSLDKIAIVAGALSVGIGFGLQSIVNNFVSGLILLWERPIKVGDLIAVGSETGRVLRINVRSTEIETADRASLIVPNAEFISGRVKNMMHANRIARIVIPISAAPDADPLQVKALLLEAANANIEVLSDPKADVIFTAVTSTALDFELRCYVDIDAQVSVRSALMFEVHGRMQRAGVLVPKPKTPASLEDLQALVPEKP